MMAFLTVYNTFILNVWKSVQYYLHLKNNLVLLI